MIPTLFWGRLRALVTLGMGTFAATLAMADSQYSVEPWRRVLEVHQNLGGLDYAALKDDRGDLDAYLTLLAGAHPDRWSVEEQIAFWCNSYNAVVAHHVLDRYPDVESVKKVSGFFDELEFPVAGREMTLDELETEARSHGDPRVHFAVVCASTSCPDLQPSPFEGAMLEIQLESATREFLGNSEKGMRFEPLKSTLHLSSIFKWYAGDFTGGSTAVAFFARGKVLDWVLQHLPDNLAAEVQKEDPGIRYLDYDWSLNDRPKTDS